MRVKGDERYLQNINRGRAGVRRYFSESFGDFLTRQNGMPDNFLIAGTGNYLRPMWELLNVCAGQIPIIILHDGDFELCNMLADIWQKFVDSPDYARHLYFCDSQRPYYEPFLGMNQQTIIECFRRMIAQKGYEISPAFSKVIAAHLDIIRHTLRIHDGEYTLSALWFLNGFRDLEEFRDNIFMLNCSEAEKQRIWGDLQVVQDPQQLYIFRELVEDLANEAQYCGWSSKDRSDYSISLTKAVTQNATLCLDFNDAVAKHLHTYLAEELKMLNRENFLLILDRIQVKNEDLAQVLCANKHTYSIGFLCEDIDVMTGSDERILRMLYGCINKYVLLHQKSSSAAKMLSEQIGYYQEIKQSFSSNSGKGFMQMLPRHVGNSLTSSVETELRVKPEHLQRLTTNQAILFDAITNIVLEV